VITMMSASVFAESVGSETVAAGRCGDNAEWALKDDGTLRVLSIRIEKKVNYFYEVTTSD
ncbi:MAG: hypothetical protein IIU74_08260, partial [Ruminiclostridium sp.]|nr:hypothetical protein [Ruminiclostridium sp.]